MPRKPEDNEVVVGNGRDGRVYGPSTVIQINLKTLVIVLGILLSGLTTAWVNLSSKIESKNDNISKEIEKINNKIEGIKDQDLKELRSNVDLIRGQLENTTRMNQEHFRQDNIINKPNNSVEVDNITPKRPK